MEEAFYHPECPILYAMHDEITNLSDCPFPLETATFKVLLFGKSKLSDKPRDTFAVVEYRKSCGHLVQERIPFCEGVEDFDHYGTKFIGADYSINNWERRIEFFRTNLPCDVCQMAEHCLWIYNSGHGENNKKKTIQHLLTLLNYNFANWKEFVDLEKVEARLRRKHA